MPKLVPLFDRLINDNLFKNKEEALPYILAGKVYIGQQRAKSLMECCDPKTPIIVKGKDTRFVSRGGIKLEYAIKAFNIDVQGRVCFDAGASTGGFTDCLLQHGARMVYAVDTGFGQLSGKLRQDKRVQNYEKTNISHPKLLTLEPLPDLGCMDLSYLSVLKGIPIYQSILRKKGEVICLVKPLFEINDPQARRSGIIPQSSYINILNTLVTALNNFPNLSVIGVAASPIRGSGGTYEFLLHVQFSAQHKTYSLAQMIIRAVSMEPFDTMIS